MAIRIRISKNIQHKGKRTNNDLQNIHIKLNTFHNKIKAYTTSINRCKNYLKIREVICLFTLVTNRGDHYHLLKINTHWHGRKGWEQESHTVKGARSINLRNPRVIFKSYQTRASLVGYDLNLTLGCHTLYDFVSLPVLDPIYLETCLELKYF